MKRIMIFIFSFVYINSFCQQYSKSWKDLNYAGDTKTDFLVMDSYGSGMAHNDSSSPESSLIGGAIQDNKDKCARANPITYIDENDPPFLILHGDKDPLVPHCNSEKLPGTYSRQWNAARLSSGIYVCRLDAKTNGLNEAGSYIEMKKLVLLK